MRRFWNVFSRRHVLLPVIHVQSAEQALRNARLARNAGCDGVFLINHGLPASELLEIHRAVFDKFHDWWTGVNCLDLRPEDVFRRITNDVAGVWVDNAMIDERRDRQEAAEWILRARLESGWQGLYFGGVAFKYQRPVGDLMQASRIAKQYMDVVTTSGPGTGQAAPREKISAMKQVLEGHPLSIASGITPENVRQYLDVADCFLVATGISRTFTEFAADRVEALVKAVRSYPGTLPPCVIQTPPGDRRVRSLVLCMRMERGKERSSWAEHPAQIAGKRE